MPTNQAETLQQEAARLKAEREALAREREKLSKGAPATVASDAAELARLSAPDGRIAPHLEN